MLHSPYTGIILGLCLCGVGPRRLPGQAVPSTDSALAAYADSAWASEIHHRVGADLGLTWTRDSGWALNREWDYADDPAQPAYASEPEVRGVLALAAARRDIRRLNDLAGLYVAYLPRFRPLREITDASARVGGRSRLLPQGSPDALVLPWLDVRSTGARWPSECALCTSQAMAPVARLLHLVALVPANRRTPAMAQFADAYVPILARDVVIRYAYQTHWRYNEPNGRPFLLESQWEMQLAGGPEPHYRMLDRDLWLIAISADLLAAHQVDSALVPIPHADAFMIRRFLLNGERMISAGENLHPVEAQGGPVTADLLFKGQFDSDPDMVNAGDTAAVRPDGSRPSPPHGGGWDVSHSQRVPTVFRSLWDARVALGSSFPDSTALAALGAQYALVAYRNGTPGPQFHNFMDGNDGWYRVGWNGKKDFTYAPPAYCDNADPTRHCLARGAASGWQLLRFAEPAVGAIGEQLFRLAADTTAVGQAYRNRVWVLPDDPMTWVGNSHRRYSPLLVQVIGEYLLGRMSHLPAWH